MSEPKRTPAQQPRQDSRGAAAERIARQGQWVELQLQRAIERGDFDDLPGSGKPLPDLGDSHDPNWWVKKMIERERVAVVPFSVQLRKEDAALDERLDGLYRESDVRREVEDFNKRVIAARYRLPEGPPLITMPRDVEETVAQWRERRSARRAAHHPDSSADPERAEPGRSTDESGRATRRWWRGIRHTDR